MALMDLEQANVTLLSENEDLKRDHLNKELNQVKESLELMNKIIQIAILYFLTYSLISPAIRSDSFVPLLMTH